jgi:hypothetical protein|eukprot:TRINITY_DN10653_c0_g1_i1.p1 TRINITY_DN10653_c0_g1~~TRINITY_DN10653_c0_g1_i1.p1  ORF type:complete len:456 (+),score=60.03 TRINITY_DN10653_c0_g1_i1:77-1444(+)
MGSRSNVLSIASVLVSLVGVIGLLDTGLDLGELGRDVEDTQGQTIHWAFVTDCSAYHYNMGAMLLASAKAVNQPGKFTWLTYGCEREEQKAAYNKLPHPRASVWHQPKVSLMDPSTGKASPHFQASNRPVTVIAWLRAVRPTEDAIGILDPDMFFMRAVHFIPNQAGDTKSKPGPWKLPATQPGFGIAAMYGIGCTLTRFNDSSVKTICGDQFGDKCLKQRSKSTCVKSYSSGPPWVMHKHDAESVLESWVGTSIRVHNAWPDLLAEQAAYGISQVQHDVDNSLDTYWFLSNTDDDSQPWDEVANSSYDPCKSRKPPAKNLAMPPVWHACSAYEMPGFKLHKDHVHKDLLDCQAPLLKHPPEDSLLQFKQQAKKGKDFRNTWSVCTYTNMINTYAGAWKKQFCDKPNLNRTFMYPDHAEKFLNESGWMHQLFRPGGWTDVDYKANGFLQTSDPKI